MMVCRAVAYRSLSIALSLAPTPSTRKRRDSENHAFFMNIIQYNVFPVNTRMSIMRRTRHEKLDARPCVSTGF